MKRRFLASMVACAGLALLGVGLVAAAPPNANSSVFPPNSHPYGQSYAQWSAKYWQWGLGLPACCPYPGNHPFVDSPEFDVTEGQSGKVWYLAAVFGTTQRTCTIPAGKSLFVAMLNSEWSSLEGFPTEAEQREFANLIGDHIVVSSLFCTIDGAPVTNLDDFRFDSPQFTFTAPTPWIFGDTGGTGTAVADGYYLLLKPLHPGHHVLHLGGMFDDFAGGGVIDMTYNLTQLAACADNPH